MNFRSVCEMNFLQTEFISWALPSNSSWHSKEGALVWCLLRKYLWFKELRWTFFLSFHTSAQCPLIWSQLTQYSACRYLSTPQPRKTKDFYCFSQVLMKNIAITMPLNSYNTVSDKLKGKVIFQINVISF